MVTLDGSASTGFPALTYTWTGPFPEGEGTVIGESPTVTLPLGTSTITLIVNDGAVDSEADTVDVTVALTVEGLQPPLAALVLEPEPMPMPGRAFRRGRTLPLKLRLVCNGVALTDAVVAAPVIVGFERAGDALDVADLDAGRANAGGLAFRFAGDHWIYNLSTRGRQLGIYIITIEMPDGLRYRAIFELR